MPGDILGNEILNKDREFQFIRGPLFSNIVLADEINRTPPKTQSALLEAMQEKQVTVAGKKYDLNNPYLVLATQNPIEQEGTYPLPEAQLDRFMFAIKLDYPTVDEEIAITKSTTNDELVPLNTIFTSDEILETQHLVRRIPVTDNVVEYAVNLVHKTRPESYLASDFTKNYVDWGAGPRASQSLILATKTHALVSGKYAPDIEDVKKVAIPILRHRVLKNYKAESEGISMEHIIENIL
ncbi:MoxR-like ATPase [Elysia marginata]|uniref:magnesium chelatase n=1 Tax=Elysia marginata TaxID=1093978 RepID=A0AAV4G7T8_9GAST|nr:MoxR-like ATPase [Elysia marginata]